MQESYVLQLIASRITERNVGYQFLLERTAIVMQRARFDRSIGKLITKRLVDAYGQKQDRTFIITFKGMEIINNAFDYATKTF